MSLKHHLTTAQNNMVDIGAIVVLLGSFTKVLPAIAATLTIVWTVIRIYETDTVQKFVTRRRRRKDDE